MTLGGISCTLELQMINDVFTTDEILYAIRSLKNHKAPGIDGIPAEMIKYCQVELIDLITDIFNYIVENRNFPDIWAEGLRSAIFKSGSRHCADNYRGITIWCIFAKLFETAVNNRLCFANEAFERKDVFNGGFQNGSRTTDNIFYSKWLSTKTTITWQVFVSVLRRFSQSIRLGE